MADRIPAGEHPASVRGTNVFGEVIVKAVGGFYNPVYMRIKTYLLFSVISFLYITFIKCSQPHFKCALMNTFQALKNNKHTNTQKVNTMAYYLRIISYNHNKVSVI